MSLDGETNLKPKMALKQIDKTMNSKEYNYNQKLKILKSIVFNAGVPEADLYNFKGEVTYKNIEGKNNT